MGHAIGIDLGTTNTVVAAVVDGVAVTLADDMQRRLIPSLVSFSPGGEVLVGEAARERRIIDPKNTIYSVKRLIGRPFGAPEVQYIAQRFPFKVARGEADSTLVVAQGTHYALPEISAFVLRRAKKIAEAALGGAVDKAVITVPANFNDLQRAATKLAGKLAGLEVLRILNEPTAAALAYGQAIEDAEKIAVYDLGGGTFDITLLDLNGSVFEVLATAGDTSLGGDDLDNAIAERLAEQFVRVHRFDPRNDTIALARLRIVSEAIKRELSLSAVVEQDVREVVFAPSGAPLDIHVRMSRGEFEVIASPLVDRTFEVTRQSMAAARLTTRDFKRVILVGGSTRMPIIGRRVAELFGQSPNVRVNPDEVVALGAALQANSLVRSGERSRTKRKGSGAPTLGALPPASKASPESARTPTKAGVGATGPGRIPTNRGIEAQKAPAPSPPAAWGQRPAQPSLPRAAPLPRVEPPGAEPPRAEAPRVDPAIQEAMRRFVQESSQDEPPTLQPRPKPPAPRPPRSVEEDLAAYLAGEPPPERVGDKDVSDLVGSAARDAFASENRLELTFPSMARMPADVPELDLGRREPSEPRIPSGPWAASAPARAGAGQPPQLGQDPWSAPKPPIPPPARPSRPGPLTSQPVQPVQPAQPTRSPVQAPPVQTQPLQARPAGQASADRAPLAPPARRTEREEDAARQDARRSMLAQAEGGIEAKEHSALLIDVTPLSLQVETVGGFGDVLVTANTPVPCDKTRIFRTAQDNQRTVTIRVAQGESNRFGENAYLGELLLSGLRPAPRGEVAIAVTFELDADGILNVKAKDRESGTETKATLRLFGAQTDTADIAAMMERQARHMVS